MLVDLCGRLTSGSISVTGGAGTASEGVAIVKDQRFGGKSVIYSLRNHLKKICKFFVL